MARSGRTGPDDSMNLGANVALIHARADYVSGPRPFSDRGKTEIRAVQETIEILLQFAIERYAMTTVVMVIAFSGLGCYNKGCDGSCGTTSYYASGQSMTNMYPSSVAHWGHGASSSGKLPGLRHFGLFSPRAALHSTLWSFVLGHDPDVPTVREIEASIDSGGYRSAVGGYGYSGGYGQ